MKRIDEKQLLLAVGEVGDDLIARAEQPVKRKSASYFHWGALAACFCLIAVLAVLPGRYGMTPDNNMAGPPQSGDYSSAGIMNGEENKEESAITGGDPQDPDSASLLDDPGAAGGPDDDGNKGGSVGIMGGELQDPNGAPATPGGLDGTGDGVQPADGQNGGTEPEDTPLPGSEGEEPVLIDPADTVLQVAHTRGGQTEEATVTGDALDALRSWAAGLTPGLEMRAFSAGQSPGDTDGGEVYDFTAPGGATSFAYIVNGPEDCWVLLDGQWYAVSSPEDPPVAFVP